MIVFAKPITCVSLALAAILIVANQPARAIGLLDDLQKTIEDAAGSLGGDGGATSMLSNDDIVAGLKDALRVGAERVVGQVGQADGYNADPEIHIPLPPSLQTVQDNLRTFGLSGLADEVELKLNRGAEAAAPEAQRIIWDAVSGMTLDDARGILDGPDDAATQYFRRSSTAELTAAFTPIMDETLREAGAIAAYDSLVGQYNSVPLVPDLKGDLTDHAVTLALDGLFHYLANEEAAIRQDPAKRTTEILTKVFGGG